MIVVLPNEINLEISFDPRTGKLIQKRRNTASQVIENNGAFNLVRIEGEWSQMHWDERHQRLARRTARGNNWHYQVYNFATSQWDDLSFSSRQEAVRSSRIIDGIESAMERARPLDGSNFGQEISVWQRQLNQMLTSQDTPHLLTDAQKSDMIASGDYVIFGDQLEKVLNASKLSQDQFSAIFDGTMGSIALAIEAIKTELPAHQAAEVLRALAQPVFNKHQCINLMAKYPQVESHVKNLSKVLFNEKLPNGKDVIQNQLGGGNYTPKIAGEVIALTRIGLNETAIKLAPQAATVSTRAPEPAPARVALAPAPLQQAVQHGVHVAPVRNPVVHNPPREIHPRVPTPARPPVTNSRELSPRTQRDLVRGMQVISSLPSGFVKKLLVLEFVLWLALREHQIQRQIAMDAQIAMALQISEFSKPKVTSRNMNNDVLIVASITAMHDFPGTFFPSEEKTQNDELTSSAQEMFRQRPGLTHR